MIVGDPQPDEVPPPLPLPDDHFRLQTSRIAGIEHHHIHQASDHLHPGVALSLIPEPANPHDKYAVRIQYQEVLLGYLPRTSNHIVSRLLRQKAPLTAQVAYLSKSPTEHPTQLPVINDISIHVLLRK